MGGIGGTEIKIFMPKELDSTGKPLWETNGVPVYSGEGDQYDPVLIADGKVVLFSHGGTSARQTGTFSRNGCQQMVALCGIRLMTQKTVQFPSVRQQVTKGLQLPSVMQMAVCSLSGRTTAMTRIFI